MADFTNLIQNFDVQNIFKSNETGLFYDLSRNKTQEFKEETRHGSKQSK